jgi:hypothetical protein
MEASDNSPEAKTDEPEGGAVGVPAPPPLAGRAALWTAALAAGLVAGVSAWLIGEAAHEFFEPAEVEVIVMGQKAMNPTFETQNQAAVKNALLVFGSLGGVLGMALGLGGGLARRAPRLAGTAAAVGLILGALAGAGAAATILPTALHTRSVRQDDLIRPFLVHSGLWVPLGAAAGLAFGLGAGRRGSGLVGPALGGALGTLLGTAAYELIGGIVFPLAQTDKVFSLTWQTRLIARLCVTLGTAAGAASGIRTAEKHPAAPHPSDSTPQGEDRGEFAHPTSAPDRR